MQVLSIGNSFSFDGQRYAVLTGRDITNNTFCDFDEPITPEQVEKAKACVKAVYEQYYG